METILTYDFRVPSGEKVSCTVLWDNELELVHKDYTGDLGRETQAGEWLLSALSQKPYEQLHKYNKVIYDFLNARLS